MYNRHMALHWKSKDMYSTFKSVITNYMALGRLPNFPGSWFPYVHDVRLTLDLKILLDPRYFHNLTALLSGQNYDPKDSGSVEHHAPLHEHTYNM